MQLNVPKVTVRKPRAEQWEGWKEPLGEAQPRSREDKVEAGDSTDTVGNRRAFREESQGHTGSRGFFFLRIKDESLFS